MINPDKLEQIAQAAQDVLNAQRGTKAYEIASWRLNCKVAPPEVILALVRQVQIDTERLMDGSEGVMDY